MQQYKTTGLIFANMHDDYLPELTSVRSMGSVPFAGRYRLIDFPVSNMVNSGISTIGVVTNSNYRSLMDHLGSGREWDLARKRGGLYIIPPFGLAKFGVYKGRMEALLCAEDFLASSNDDFVVMTDCDNVMNIDYSALVEYHIRHKADITMVYQNMHIPSMDKSHTIFLLDRKKRVTETVIGVAEEGDYNVSLNVAVIDKSLLLKLIRDCESRSLHSFKQDVLQHKANELNIIGYEHKGQIACIDSLKSYYEANMMLLDHHVMQKFFPRDLPIYTKVRDEAPVKYGLGASVSNSLIADGCWIEGTVENSVIFRGVKIGRDTVVRNSVIMQDTIIGENVSVNYIITDKTVQIKDGRNIMGFASYPVFIQKGSVV